MILIACIVLLLNISVVVYRWKHKAPPVTTSQPPVIQKDNKSNPLPPDEQKEPTPPPRMEVVPEFVSVPKYRNSEQDSVYGDIISHSKDAPFGDRAGRGTNAHETTHGINSEIRNSNQKQGKKINGFYVLEGRGVVMEEPKIKMSNAVKFVPKNLQSYRWNLYMVQQIRQWDNTPTYIFDEWVAYVNGGACHVDDAKKNKDGGKWTDGVSGCCDFSIYSMALGMATKKDDPEYWRNYPQFKNFLIWELKFAEKVFLEGRVMSQYKWKKQDDLLLQFLESSEAEEMRKFCREELDGVWVGINPADIKNTDHRDGPTKAEEDEAILKKQALTQKRFSGLIGSSPATK